MADTLEITVEAYATFTISVDPEDLVDQSITEYVENHEHELTFEHIDSIEDVNIA